MYRKKKKQTKAPTDKKRLSASKWLILFLFINCSLVEIFTGYATVKMLDIARETGMSIDFTPLVTLIGTVVTEVIGYAVYSVKAMKENLEHGITYETAMVELLSKKED